MAVFRVERNSGYTVMSNHHLRNKELTLKAKGLLSQMLSLPEDWDYTLAGLSHINRESIDAIRTAVWELEKAGYILRRQGRDEKGKMTAIEYTIYEQPQPVLENPIPGKPMLENPTTDNPTSENPTQLNKDRSRTNLSKKEKSITNLSSTDSFPILSPDPSPCRAAPERKGTEAVKQSAVDIYREIIMENIEYDALMQNPKMDKERLDEIVDLMLETVCSARKTLRIAGDDYPAELVKSKFLKLNSSHIEFVMDCMRENTTKIRNIKQYLRAVLFNAPSTIDNYYTALVAHDMASPDWGKPKSGIPDYSCSPDESLKAIYKDNADTIVGNCDTMLFLGGKEKTTLKEISEILGKETIDSFNTSENRGKEISHGLNYQKLGKELMTQDEIATMDGGMCILQLRGVRPFFSKKYDITKHPRYKYLSDADKKNTFDVERYIRVQRKKKKHPSAVIVPEEPFDLYEIELSDEDADFTVAE